MKIRKTLLLVILVISVLLITVSADTEKVFKPGQGYLYWSEDYITISNKLLRDYNDILEVEVLGYSTDGKPIRVIRMRTSYTEEDYANKMHILIEAGTHSRETVNPSIVLETLEDYCIDYYNNDHLKDVDIRKELEDSVIHFIIISNPDGHDLTKFGLRLVNNKDILKKVNSTNYPRFKANINGVDINRNYEDIYFDGTKWVDQWGGLKTTLISHKPSGEFYAGPNAASEIETQIMQQYLLKYDFRVVISYHSMGRVVYYDRPHLSNEFNKMSLKYAQIVKDITGYRIMPRDPVELRGSGFMSHYFSNNTLKPIITIETTNGSLPSSKVYYEKEYSQYKLWLIPVKFLAEARRVGYYEYKVYKDGIYVTDFMDEKYAHAVAEKIGGKVEVYNGKPYYKQSVNANEADGYLAIDEIKMAQSDPNYIIKPEIMICNHREDFWYSPNKHFFTEEEWSKDAFSLFAGYIKLENFEEYEKYSPDIEFRLVATDKEKDLLNTQVVVDEPFISINHKHIERIDGWQLLKGYRTYDEDYKGYVLRFIYRDEQDLINRKFTWLNDYVKPGEILNFKLYLRRGTNAEEHDIQFKVN